MSFLSFEYLIKCFKPVCSRLLIKNWYFASYESLAYKHVLSISRCLLIKLNNGLVYPDQDPPIINILYGWPQICGPFGLWSFMFSFVTSKLIIFVSFCYIVKCNHHFFYLLDLCRFHMHMFLSNWFIALFYHHLNLKQSC